MSCNVEDRSIDTVLPRALGWPGWQQGKAERNQVDSTLPDPLAHLIEVYFLENIGKPWFGGHLTQRDQ